MSVISSVINYSKAFDGKMQGISMGGEGKEIIHFTLGCSKNRTVEQHEVGKTLVQNMVNEVTTSAMVCLTNGSSNKSWTLWGSFTIQMSRLNSTTVLSTSFRKSFFAWCFTQKK